MSTARFVFLTDDELLRARRRVTDPTWAAAVETLRSNAEELIGRSEALPVWDWSWYDADPDRDYGQTYQSFAAYGSPTISLGRDISTLLKAAAVLEQERYAQRALAWATHMIERFSFHVRHHDEGLFYSKPAAVLVEAYFALGDQLSDAADALWRKQLTAAGEAICRSREHWRTKLSHMPYNNHLAHHQRGLLSVGLALDRDDWIDLALNGRGGFAYLLPGCTVDDGLCYESSTVYHFVTLEGLAGAAETVRHFPTLGRDLYRETFANGVSLKNMFDAPLSLMLPNGELPSVGDCYASREPMWRSRQAVYELAYAVYGDPRYAWMIERAGRRETIDGLLYGAETLGPVRAPEVRSRVWIEHGYALISSAAPEAYWSDDSESVTAVMAGDLSGIHHHLDSLSLQVFASGRLWTEDVESEARAASKFADPIQVSFNRTVWAHNTVVVDQKDQEPITRPLQVTSFKDLPGFRTVTMVDADGRLYPGVGMSRSVAVTDDYCLDVYEVDSRSEHTYDWLVHPRADARADGPGEMTPITLPDQRGYCVLTDVAAADVDADGVSLQWRQDDRDFRLDVSAGVSGQLIRAAWPVVSDGSEGARAMFMYRIRAAQAAFVALYQVGGDGRLWRVESSGRVFNGDHDEFRVTVTDGQQTREHIFKSLSRMALPSIFGLAVRTLLGSGADVSNLF